MKKKFFALGMALVATFALAACDDANTTTTTKTGVTPTTTEAPATTTEAPATTTEAPTTTTEAPATTTEAPVEYVFHEGEASTYDSKGYKSYYTIDGEDGKYYDEDKNPVSVADLILDYLALDGEVVSIDENGNAVVNLTRTDLLAAYGYEYLLKVTFEGKDPVEVPVVKWMEEVEDNDLALTSDGTVQFNLAGGNFAETYGVAAGDKFTLKLIDDKNFVSKIEALNHIYDTAPVNVNGRELTVEFEMGTEDTYLAKGQAVLDAIKEENVSNEELIALYDEFGDAYYFVVDQYRNAKILSDRDNTEESYDLADALEALMGDFGELDERIDLAAYKSEKYMEYYYLQYPQYVDEEGHLDVEAVKAYVDGLNPEATAELNEIDQQMSAALSDYYAGRKSASEALYSYFTSAKAYASLAGYDDYLSFAYENQYGREYSVADTDALADYIVTYLIPGQMDAITDYLTYRAAAKADTSSDLFMEYNFGLWGLIEDDFYGKYFEYIADYAENVIGDEMGENFKYYFTSGNYWYSATENDNVTGYVWSFTDGTPLMFLGPKCQEIGTFIHEFGHYNEKLTGASSSFYSMDLNEVHSQANEMLFYKYLTTTDVYSEAATKAFLSYKTYMMINTVIEGYLINELEKWVYTQDMTSFADADAFYNALTAEWANVCKAVGLDDYATATNWVNVVLLNYQGYYISYATSAIAALEVYAYSCKDWDAAVDAYKFLYSPHDADDTFTSVLEKAGLYSIFNEEAFKMIADAIGYDYTAAATEE